MNRYLLLVVLATVLLASLLVWNKYRSAAAYLDAVEKLQR